MLMKKIIAACVILVVLVPGLARGGETERLAMAVVLVENSRLPQRFVDLAEAFMETYFERYDKPLAENPAEGNPFRKIFLDEVRLGEEELKLMLAEIYAAHFSENELREIVNFFNTPSGKAWLEKRPILETEAEQIGLEWGQLLTQKVLKKFEAATGEKILR
jgi:predicted nucleotidyltransferase